MKTSIKNLIAFLNRECQCITYSKPTQTLNSIMVQESISNSNIMDMYIKCIIQQIPYSPDQLIIALILQMEKICTQ